MKVLLSLFIFFSFSAHAQSWNQVTKLMDNAFKARLFGAGGLYVGDGAGPRFEHHLGESDSGKIFDVASLTKVVATATSVMVLEQQGRLSLSDKLSVYFPKFSGGLKDDVTIEDLLRHRAGLAAGARPATSEGLEAYVTRITQAALNYRPRSKTVYSDLSFILLGRIVEMISGKTLASFSDENIFRPLKMVSTTFSVPSENLNRCIPTSVENNCKVHDPTARALLPASVGNAGVFSNIEDLSRLARMYLNKGELDGVRILEEATVVKMGTPIGPRALGWDSTSEYATAPRGDVFPAGISFGHTGYTGTTMWIDPKSQTFYLFLSNRVFMGDTRTSKPFTVFRRQISTAIAKTIYEL